MKYVVLSGVSGGMGLAIAKRLTKDGYTVFGLDIKPVSEEIDNLIFIKTNLRDSNSILEAFDKVNEVTKEIDAIINTAGIYDLNSLIEISEEDFMKIFDINVFAIYRLNKVFVHMLKERGKVIMISSELAPLDPLPFTGLYAITKSTIEKYAYSLRMELQLLNKQVVVIRPGAVNTSLLDVSTSRLDEFTKNTELYKYNAEKFKSIVDSVENKKIPPEKIANLVYKILIKKKPRYVYKINRNPLLIMLNITPKKFQNWVIKKILLSKKKSH
ncbi:MAG: SDR family NAD(P)-dependent oxidoreductase [Bacilli bacterium]|nr:SDR family NAD(P)-dependent oxidoreductase [Bacilli bacterium]